MMIMGGAGVTQNNPEPPKLKEYTLNHIRDPIIISGIPIGPKVVPLWHYGAHI